MSLTREFFERATNIKAKVICDSISKAGQRIITFEIEYPRFILAELNTHKMLEKNSSSSRAIPISKMIEQIIQNMALPLYWGKTRAGMQATEEIEDIPYAEAVWRTAFESAVGQVGLLEGEKLHKQTANRLLEPFQMMKTVITGTDWDNFFNLRIHPDAQPEFCMLAYKMYMAMQESTPTVLRDGEWHLPYVEIMQYEDVSKTYYFTWNIDKTGTETDGYMFENKLTLEEAQRVSASCCAQTSYRKSDDSLEKADSIFDKLVHADVLHASPFGHLATPIKNTEHGYGTDIYINSPQYPQTWEQGITHMRRDGVLCSGNLAGWVSYRHLMPNNTCYDFNFEERMKLFDVAE